MGEFFIMPAIPIQIFCSGIGALSLENIVCLDPYIDGGYITQHNRIKCDYPHLIVIGQRLKKGPWKIKHGFSAAVLTKYPSLGSIQF